MAGISWEQATNFCGRLTDAERAAGRLPAGYIYRLPTEAEWEYSCRAGGPDVTIASNAWHEANNGAATHAVAGLAPNPWGVYDIHGNLSEYCFDNLSAYPSGPVSDPVGLIHGMSMLGEGAIGAHLPRTADVGTATKAYPLSGVSS